MEIDTGEYKVLKKGMVEHFKTNALTQMITTLAACAVSIVALMNFSDTADTWIMTENEHANKMEMHVVDNHEHIMKFQQTQNCRWFSQNIKSLDHQIYTLKQVDPVDVPRVNQLTSQLKDYQSQYSEGRCWKKEHK